MITVLVPNPQIQGDCTMIAHHRRETGPIRTVVLGIITVTALFIALNGFSQTIVKKVGVFTNPRDKKRIVGYTKIALAWGEQLRPPRELSRGVINLKDAMRKYTKIETDLVDHLLLSSNDIFTMPLIYVTTKEAFQLTPTERDNLKKYIDLGGFIVADNALARPERSPGGASLKQMLRDVIPNARFAPINNGHPFYHCFFDFDDGPPQGSEVGLYGDFSGTGSQDDLRKRQRMSKRVNYLEGVWYRGRLAAVYSDKGYIVKWNETSNNEPQLRMGVNMIVFSLIQEGGIAEVH